MSLIVLWKNAWTFLFTLTYFVFCAMRKLMTLLFYENAFSCMQCNTMSLALAILLLIVADNYVLLIDVIFFIFILKQIE